jgi:hypothetical protein
MDSLNRKSHLNLRINMILELIITILGIYSVRFSEKRRCPSYCDRILWKNNPLEEKDWLNCVSYNCTMNLYTSDHKPVSALFHAKVVYY